MGWQDTYMQRFYEGRPDWQDGTSRFVAMVERHLPRDGEILELGCGSENPFSAYLAARFDGRVDGLDVDPACQQNHHLRRTTVYDGGDFPVGDQRYDGVICNYVLEHVERPDRLANEVSRILRPGGVFLFRTPNKWHYVSLVSRLTHHGVHEKLANTLRDLDEQADDPFPTHYRMNSRRALRETLGRAGLIEREMQAVESEPSYGMKHPALFLGFMLYERLVNSGPEFEGLRANFFGAFQKPRGDRD